jgi:hypothetical protein
MNKVTIKKTLIWSGSVFLFLVLVLCVHIYVVTRPKPIKPISPYSRTMVRIDMHQPITQKDADTIYAWLVKQKGMDKAYVNLKSDKVLFLFYTDQNTGNDIVKGFKENFHYDSAHRYMPTVADIQSGCPVVAVAYTEKIAKFFGHIF